MYITKVEHDWFNVHHERGAARVNLLDQLFPGNVNRAVKQNFDLPTPSL